jgi:hypothetical protein
MRPNISKFRIFTQGTNQQYWANYADENVMLLTHERAKGWVDLTDPVINYVSTHAPGLMNKRTPLQDFLVQSGRVRMIDGDYIKWKLKGTGEVVARSRENLHPGVESPGIQSTEFQLKLDVEWYVPGDVLFPDAAKDVQVIVQGSEPISDGTGFIYTVQLVTRNPNAFFPPQLLAPDTKWIKMDSVYGEGSEGYGSFQTTGNTWIEFRSSLTDYGKTVEVTNKAHDLNIHMKACDYDGKLMKDYPEQIISYIEAEFLAQARWEKELRLFFGRSSGRDIIDYTIGHHRRIGPGLLEFMEDGNVVEYPIDGGSLEMFIEYLTSVWFDRVDPASRQVTVYTGQAGLQLIQKWIQQEFGGSNVQSDFNTFVSKGGKTYGKGYEGLIYKTAYFTEIQLFPFGKIRFEHWPILDSRHINGGVLHPKTGIPLSSYHFIILDYGLGTGGSSNIELLQRKGANAHTYVCGTWSPLGAINQRSGKGQFVATGPQRRYQLFHTDTYGLRVKDVTLTAWFMPSVDL